MNQDRPIGVFDSGVGGIGTLREIMQVLPHEHFVFYGDNGHAPYGVKAREEILNCTWDVVNVLQKKNIKALVIACNTATSTSAESFRSALDIPVIGIEPALKPASAFVKPGEKLLVLATPATLSLKKFQLLMAQYGENAVMVPCAGLMEFAERGEFEGDGIDAYLNRILAPYKDMNVTAAVLGCTHYVFLKKAILKALPGVMLFDGNKGLANHLKDVLEERNLLRTHGEGSVEFMTSGDEARCIGLMKRLLYGQENG